MLKIPKKVNFFFFISDFISGYVCIYFFKKLKKGIIALLWCRIPWYIYFCYIATKKLVTCNKIFTTILLPKDYSRKKQSIFTTLPLPPLMCTLGTNLLMSFFMISSLLSLKNDKYIIKSNIVITGKFYNNYSINVNL